MTEPFFIGLRFQLNWLCSGSTGGVMIAHRAYPSQFRWLSPGLHVVDVSFADKALSVAISSIRFTGRGGSPGWEFPNQGCWTRLTGSVFQNVRPVAPKVSNTFLKDSGNVAGAGPDNYRQPLSRRIIFKRSVAIGGGTASGPMLAACPCLKLPEESGALCD